MNKINFLDVKKNYYYYIKDNTLSNEFSPLEDITDIDLSSEKPKKSLINNLYNHLLNSLKYQSETNSFPSTLPEEINIKFTQLSLLERLNPFNSKDIAQVNITNNTIYMSTEFLSTPKDSFLKEFSQKFTDKQSLIDAIFYHEFAHIISTHHFPQISNTYSKLNHNKILQSPLYQILRNVEENFSDAYAALLHKEKHNAFDIYHYVASRNSTNLGKSKDFDFNIYSLGKSFNKVNNIDISSQSIDETCNMLYSISIISALEILEKTISSNSEFKQKLINNLELLNLKTSNIFYSIEDLLSKPKDNLFIIPNKESVNTKLMNIRNYSITKNNITSKFKN